MVLDVDFQVLLEEHEDFTGCLLEDEVDCLLANYPFSLKNERGMEDLSHDLFPPEGMSDFVEMALQVILHGTQIYFLVVDAIS